MSKKKKSDIEGICAGLLVGGLITKVMGDVMGETMKMLGYKTNVIKKLIETMDAIVDEYEDQIMKLNDKISELEMGREDLLYEIDELDKKLDAKSKSRKKIKNPSIVHMLDDNGRYLCNRAVSPTPEKSTKSWKKVTCANCIEKRI